MSWVEDNAFRCKSIEDLLIKYKRTVASIENTINTLNEEINSFENKYGKLPCAYTNTKRIDLKWKIDALNAHQHALNELEHFISDNLTPIGDCFLQYELKYLNINFIDRYANSNS